MAKWLKARQEAADAQKRDAEKVEPVDAQTDAIKKAEASATPESALAKRGAWWKRSKSERPAAPADERAIPDLNESGLRPKHVAAMGALGVLIVLIMMLPKADSPREREQKATPERISTRNSPTDEAPPSQALASRGVVPPEVLQELAAQSAQPEPAAPPVPAPMPPVPPGPVIIPAPKATPAAPATPPAGSATPRPLTNFERRLAYAEERDKAAPRRPEPTPVEAPSAPPVPQPSPVNLIPAQPPSAGSASPSSQAGVDLAIALPPKNQSLMISAGRRLECTLDPAISSDVVGNMTCTLSRPAYSDDGKVVLLERGTQLFGVQQGGVQLGQRRLNVVWTRARTPSGVSIALGSRAADSLGRNGIPGEIDTHFWERFGAAILMSSIDDAFAIALAAAQKRDGGTTVVIPQGSVNVARNAASIAVENSARINPTLYATQGAIISVLVARDLDFSNVYEVRQKGEY